MQDSGMRFQIHFGQERMNMHFFLQGSPGIGKSFLLRGALSPWREALAGFSVQRLYQKGELLGFRVIDAAQDLMRLDLHLGEREEVALGEQGVFMYRGQRDLSVLEDTICKVLAESRKQECRIVLLDEIGGSELGSDLFMETLYEILKGGRPCIGVLKSAENLRRMVSHFGQEDAYIKRHEELAGFLEKNGTLLTMTKENRDLCARSLEKYRREWERTDGNDALRTGL